MENGSKVTESDIDASKSQFGEIGDVGEEVMN